MNYIKYFLISASIIFFSISSFSQNSDDIENPSLNDGSIYNQYEYVLKTSTNYLSDAGKAYEVVKKENLIALRKNTLDSLKTLQTKLLRLNNTVNTQQKEIESLRASFANTKSDLEATNTQKDSMSFFGILISKVSYNIIMWLIITVLLALLSLFIYKYKNSNFTTKNALQNLTDLEQEFEEHRKTALEREQKVRRQLVDEMNKNKSKRGK